MAWNAFSGIYIFFFGTRSCFYNAGLKIFTVVDTLYDPTNNPPMSIITHSSTLCYETITNHFAIKTFTSVLPNAIHFKKHTSTTESREAIPEEPIYPRDRHRPPRDAV